MSYNIFIAWQSQKRDINLFIKNQLRKAKAYLKSSYDMDINLIFSPTQGESGSPNISLMIKEKISQSDVFIGDLTPIAESEDGKLISNSNVMYETGLAISFLTENQIILLVDSAITIDQLCFDLNHNRISPINQHDSATYKSLSLWIKLAIQDLTRSRFLLNYITNDIMDSIIVIYNNLFRLIYKANEYYPSDFQTLSLSDVKNNIQQNSFDIFQVKADYKKVISKMSANVKEIIGSQNGELLYHMIKFIEMLSDYEEINIKTNYSCFEEIEMDTDTTYGFQTNETIHLDDITNYNDIKTALVFRDDTYILSTLSTLANIGMQNIYFKNSIDYLLEQLTQASVEGQYYIGIKFYKNIQSYKLKSNYIDNFGNRIFQLITEANTILDLLNKVPTDMVDMTRKGNLLTFKSRD